MSQMGAKERLIELIREFRRCRERHGVKYCGILFPSRPEEGECPLTKKNCELFNQHEEYWRILSANPDIFWEGPQKLEKRR